MDPTLTRERFTMESSPRIKRVEQRKFSDSFAHFFRTPLLSQTCTYLTREVLPLAFQATFSAAKNFVSASAATSFSTQQINMSRSACNV